MLLNLVANNDTGLGARRTRPASGGKEQVERDGTGAKGRNLRGQVGRHSLTRQERGGHGKSLSGCPCLREAVSLKHHFEKANTLTFKADFMGMWPVQPHRDPHLEGTLHLI